MSTKAPQALQAATFISLSSLISHLKFEDKSAWKEYSKYQTNFCPQSGSLGFLIYQQMCQEQSVFSEEVYTCYIGIDV